MLQIVEIMKLTFATIINTNIAMQIYNSHGVNLGLRQDIISFCTITRII